MDFQHPEGFKVNIAQPWTSLLQSLRPFISSKTLDNTAQQAPLSNCTITPQLKLKHSYHLFDISSIATKFEEVEPSHPSPPVPAQSSTMSLSPPPTPHTSTTTATPVTHAPMDVGGPILSHIATISSHAEDTVTSITHDMDMSTIAYLARRATGKSLQSQLNLYQLNNLLQHVVKFATDENGSGYLDGVTPDRLERACNSSSHLYYSIEAVGTKVRLFARCNKRRVKNIKRNVIRVIRELEESVEKFVGTIEAHLEVQLQGWALLLELFRFAREAWEEVVA
ncbi:hypothetical protein NA56DRAFT_708978 [Hyaloscypha hepaticicola]|uniref:Uncharacterized protein n=1 Tax=Hyaloscypha hepaticicola TaxID=2082293 RepID=A0A2J6PQX0_9HELO|nr:hypothetical protein NA56DRAFT_708978 [Hyaloscypha hepaticicola]